MEPKFAEQVLNEGIDQSGEELVAMNGIDRLVNGEFRREGGITRRKGFESPTDAVVSTATVGTAGHTLVANGRSLSVLRKLDAVNVDSSVNDGVNASAREFVLPGTVETSAQLRDSAGFGNANVAVVRVGGVLLACVVGQLSGAESASTKWRASIVEVDTGMLLNAAEVIGQRPVPIAVASGNSKRFHVLYRTNSAAEIYVKSWDSDTNAWVGETSLLDGATPSANAYPAVCADPDDASRCWVAFADTSETSIRLRHLNFNQTINASSNISVTEVEHVALCTALEPTGNRHLHLAYSLIDGASVRMLGRHPNGSTTAETVMLTRTSASYGWRNISIADIGDVNGTNTYGVVVAGCETTGTLTGGNVRRRYATYTLGGSPVMPTYVAGTEVVDSNLYLLAEVALLQPDDLAETTLDEAATPALFMSRITDEPGVASRLTTTHSFLKVLGLGRWVTGPTPGLGAGMLTSAYTGVADDTNATYERFRLSRVDYDSTSHSYFVAALDLEEAPATGTITYGIRVLRYSFSTYRADAQPLPRAQLGDLTYIGGNLLRCYDGSSVMDAGPMHPPQAPTLAQTNTGSLTLLGTYTIQAVLLFEDAKGLVHRSPPSPATSITLTGANNAITCTWDLDVFPTSRPFSALRLEVYRSEADGTALYFEESVSLLEGAGSTVVTVDAADAAVTANKLVYVTGDVLASEQPPPSRALVAVGNRLFGISSVDPRTVFFSKEVQEGFAAEFNSVLQFRVEASASEPVALGALNDLLVIFTRDEAWAVSTHGGPDALGAGTFGLPERISNDCGASSPESAVSTPFGILVHSPNGFKLLSGGQAADVPAVVDIAGPGTEIVRSMHVPERTEAWFIVRGDSTSNRIVVFSYARGKVRWATHEVAHTATLSMRDMANVRGTPWLLVEHGAAGANAYELRRLSATRYVDGSNSRPTMTVRTRWFKPEAHVGSSRFWKLHIFGTYGARDLLQADVYVMDASGLPADDEASTDFLAGTYEWTQAKLTVDDRMLHVRQRLRRQGGAAARVELRLVDSGSGAATDRGPVLSAVGWDYGARGGSASRGPTQGGA